MSDSSVLTIYDYIVIAVYFAFMASIGIITKRMISNTSDYFRGGGKMLWWMAGASAFMTQFSAWSFTGAASEAYKNGPIVLTIFLANALGFAGNAFYFAPKFRQMRVVTPIQAVRQRYGSTSEQFFTWLQIPVGTLQAGVWLYGLAIFISSVFGLPLVPTIVITGVIVVINSVLGGSWAVVSSDFMQTVILMLIAVVTAIFALIDVGGPGNLVAQFPAKDLLLGNDYNYPALIIAWMALMFFNQFCKTNQMIEASRYLNAKDSNNARKAAMLSMCLFIFGPVLWFIPPMVTRINYPDLLTKFPTLETSQKASEAAYVAIAVDVLPVGMIGLLVAGMFAATISSMDSGLNRNAGILVKNFYLAVVNKQATDGQQMFVAKALTIALGAVTIAMAIFYNSLKGLPLFDLMLSLGALVTLPMAVPLILGIVIKKTPDWAGWGTTLVGLTCSALVKFVFNAGYWDGVFGWELTGREVNYFNVGQAVLINITIPTAFYFMSMLFYKEPKGERLEQVEGYFKNLSEPVVSTDEDEGSDASQGTILGGLAAAYGTFVTLLCLVPNEASGRITFLIAGLALVSLGALLYKSTRPKKKLAA